jgi:hypothetical protein
VLKFKFDKLFFAPVTERDVRILNLVFPLFFKHEKRHVFCDSFVSSELFNNIKLIAYRFKLYKPEFNRKSIEFTNFYSNGHS